MEQKISVKIHKEQEEKERLVDILAGKAKCCRDCGSFKFEEFWMGSPINYESQSFQMKKTKCLNCGHGYLRLEQIEHQ